MQRPRFRAIEKCYAGSNWRYPGSEFDLLEWPQPAMGEMVALNVEAQRVLAYQREHRMAHAFPARLMQDNGEIYLPAYPGHHVAWQHPAPAETRPLPDAPRYQTQGHRLLGGVRHPHGDLVIFLGWPGWLKMLPLNEIAKKIVAYEAAFSHLPDFPHSPWCLYRAGPYLPDLNGENLAEAPYRRPPRSPHVSAA